MTRPGHHEHGNRAGCTRSGGAGSGLAIRGGSPGNDRAGPERPDRRITSAALRWWRYPAHNDGPTRYPRARLRSAAQEARSRNRQPEITRFSLLVVTPTRRSSHGNSSVNRRHSSIVPPQRLLVATAKRPRTHRHSTITTPPIVSHATAISPRGPANSFSGTPQRLLVAAPMCPRTHRHSRIMPPAIDDRLPTIRQSSAGKLSSHTRHSSIEPCPTLPVVPLTSFRSTPTPTRSTPYSFHEYPEQSLAGLGLQSLSNPQFRLDASPEADASGMDTPRLQR